MTPYRLCLGAVAGALLGLATAGAQGRPPAPVVVAEIVSRPLVERVQVVGTVHPRRTSLVASLTEGRVVARAAEAGLRLHRGDLLVRLEDEALRARLVEALADVELRRFRHQQSQELRADDAISEDQALEAAYQLERARAALQDLRARLSDLAVRAPFDGAVVESLVEIGEWVGRGQAVARLVAIDTVRVYTDVPERHLPRLGLGAAARVTLPALGTRTRVGRVVAVLDQGRADSRTFPVVVELLNPDGAIRGGMSAQVVFALDHGHRGLLVHKDAIVTGTHGAYLYVVADGVARRRAVDPGLAREGLIAVRGDSLRAGDLAVVRGNERLRPGQAVRVLRKQP